MEIGEKNDVSVPERGEFPEDDLDVRLLAHAPILPDRAGKPTENLSEAKVTAVDDQLVFARFELTLSSMVSGGVSAMMMPHHAQTFLVDASADKENANHQPAETEHSVHHECPAHPFYE